MKIAIFGGTFNPVHNEHVNIVKAAKDALALDKIFIVPTFSTPKKEGLSPSAQDRLNMCRLAFADIEGAEVSDFEIQNGGTSYSYITCRAFRQKFPEDELYFIVGADMLENFPQWKNPDEILNLVILAACARNDKNSLNKALAKFNANFKNAVKTFNYVGAKVSSSRVRTLAALGEDISPFVPKPCSEYVKKNNLYARPDLQKVKEYLTPSRWAHTVRVAIAATENCRRAGVDENSALTAAALHDCAKYLKPDGEQLKDFKLPDDVPEPVIHQYTGAHVAQKVFGVTDENILQAIRCHCSGKPDMTALDKLIYLSDMLEEGRTFEGVEYLRTVFADNIDKAMEAALEHNLKYLNSTGGQVYPLTVQAYEYLKGHKNDK